MREVTTKVYTYNELNDAAKAKAREWWRDGGLDYDWWDSTYEDAVTIAALFGLEIKTSIEKYHVMGRGGKPGTDRQRVRTHIMFTGFWSQGDGACFEGRYEYKAGALKAVKSYAPLDKKLHEIVRELQAAQKAARNRIKLDIRHADNHYVHERTMSMELDAECDFDSRGRELPQEKWITNDQRKAVAEALIRFANWIYRRLEEEHEYLTSDEAVAETITANEYEFTEDGERA